ncbi:EAL domain-containing protein [Actinotalea sp. M2MS4P-6]|uniref:putative bifunctional diguanylate cyclase/phosphodiesterase n=1 Tax=Actinotalea sp. M2MS4P-6 TaxID=2983762 RepID=UPI0021E4C3CC|nr:EAL domain-containing protein [Actinotalea sp. M2MS4P-6]MCV2396492.1 EAL domain-containing protein [Actinotalea sp. M2MS4P-6]
MRTARAEHVDDPGREPGPARPDAAPARVDDLGREPGPARPDAAPVRVDDLAWWAGAALDETFDPIVLASPEPDAHAPTRLVVVYANAAALAWGKRSGFGMGLGSELTAGVRGAQLLEAFLTGHALVLDGVQAAPGSATFRFIDLRATRLGDQLLVTWHDVSRRFEAERERAAAQARFEAVLRNHPDPAMLALPVLDDDGAPVDLRAWYLNRAAREWGIDEGTRLGAQLGRTDSVDLLTMGLEVVRTGHPAVVDDVRVVAEDGSSRWVDLRAVEIDGGLIASWRDVTARHAADEALTASEERFRLAFDDAPVGMAIAQLDEVGLRYVKVNGTYAAMLGMEPVQMEGRLGTEFAHPDDRARDEELLAGLRAGDRTGYRRDKRLVRADGETVWVRMSAAPAFVDGGPQYVITHVEDITERRAVEAELERRALYDSLTGLANRTLLMDHLAQTTRTMARTGGRAAVLYLDLDHFKDVNDTLGHAAGDDLLREVSTRITDVLRADATAARIAGDEFVVGSLVADDLSAVRIAERLHAAIIRPILLGTREIVVRPSIGVATTTDPTTSGDDLLRRADLAMYHAKHRGADPWALYDDDLHALAVGRLAVEEDLRTALRDDGFRLLYQPVVSLPEGTIVAAEALLRLEHPERGLLSPAEFIDVAEDSELIVPIGGWVLQEATRQLARWQEIRPGTQMSVNVSPRQVRHLAVRDQVVSALAASGLRARDLHLEITERVLLDANEDMLAELRDITSEGCGLAIDDFGTGYSSLAYLTRFPVTQLKIDRSFVSGLGRREQDTAVVEAIIGLARALGLVTVAEGVETAEQLGLLKEMGCTRAQGYLIGRPMTGERLTALLEE